MWHQRPEEAPARHMINLGHEGDHALKSHSINECAKLEVDVSDTSASSILATIAYTPAPLCVETARLFALSLYDDDHQQHYSASSYVGQELNNDGEPSRLRRIHYSYSQDDDEAEAGMIDHQSLLMQYLAGNPHTDSLQISNILRGMTLARSSSLTRALNLSTLRHLNLSGNLLGPKILANFVNTLQCPGLVELLLSATMKKPNDWTQMNRFRQDRREFEAALIALLEPHSKPMIEQDEASQETHQSEKGWAPNLQRLSLNGNELGARIVKRIVQTILGQDGEQKLPNKRLKHVELFGTFSNESEESDEEGDGLRRSLGQQGGPRRAQSITSLLRMRNGTDRNLDLPLSGETTRDAMALETPARTQRDQDKAPIDSKSGEQVSSRNWRRLLGTHLWENLQGEVAVRDCARQILGPIRVLGCLSKEKSRCDESFAKDTHFPLAKLPPELRRRIVELLLDDECALSDKQLEHVISFACCRETISYGAFSHNVGLSNAALNKIEAETKWSKNGEIVSDISQQEGLIPHHPWSWIEMMTYRSVPRDWPAVVFDDTAVKAKAQDEHEVSYHFLCGGGGGPDGEGGGTHSGRNQSLSKERRAWLWEQPDLRAFWEATGTTALDGGWCN